MSDKQANRAMIAEAETLVGAEDDADYRLQPTGFAALFDASAPAFAALLGESALTQTARRYHDKDADAVREQATFRRLSAQATWAIFAATVAAAAMPVWAVSPWASAAGLDPVALLLALVAAAAGFWATILVSRLKGGGYLARWMSARAGAETERLGYFDKLAALLARQREPDPGQLLLALELFRRYQLGLQQVYYRQRGRQHRASLERTLWIAAVASGILALGAGGIGVYGAFNPQWLPVAALGVLGSALAGVASRREEINQDERNGERYARTADILDHLREKHSDVQRALAAGKTEVLVNYVGAVHEQLSLEHRQWLSQADAIASAVEQLDRSLAEDGAEEPAG